MRNREIVLWLDERWYAALSRHQIDGTVEDKLNSYLANLIDQLPESEFNRISSDIREEELRENQQWEESRRFSVFHVKENGSESYLQLENGLEFLDAARMLRAYLRGEYGSVPFSQALYKPEEISAAQFHEMASLRMENTGKVTGAFELDFDTQTMSALNIMDGWKTYSMKDVSTAVYYAYQKRHLPEEWRWNRFLERLDGKELRTDVADRFLHGQRQLADGDISFSEAVILDDNLLEFRMEVPHSAEEIFSDEIIAGSGGSVDIYAKYDMELGQVCDTLDIYLVYGDGMEQEYKYRLSQEECGAMLSKMEAFCIQNKGLSLAEAAEQILSEQEAPQMGQSM